jgi:hypothetical protein
VEGLSGQMASDKIIKELLEIKKLEKGSIMLLVIFKCVFFSLIYFIKNIIKLIIKKNKFNLGNKYLDHKSPKIKKKELILIFCKFDKILKFQSSKIYIKKIYNSCLLIKK